MSQCLMSPDHPVKAKVELTVFLLFLLLPISRCFEAAKSFLEKRKLYLFLQIIQLSKTNQPPLQINQIFQNFRQKVNG